VAHTEQAATLSHASMSRLPKRTILVHDYLNQYGGAERVLEAMHDLAPNAPVVTSIYLQGAMPESYRNWNIRPLWLDRIPGARRRHQRLLPAYAFAFQRARLPACDLVLSSSSAFAKMVRAPSGALHIAYIHSPMRFAWDLDGYVRRERLPAVARQALRPLMAFMRERDTATSGRVHYLIANSTAVQARIRAFWRRDATVIHPPVDVERFQPVAPEHVGDYYLMVSRLVPYKRFDLAIEAANALGISLRIVGDGRDRPELERIAGPTVHFLGKVSDSELNELYARCKAAIFMSEDDFGIAQVEAQAAGRPVVAYAAGGAWDTVIPDRTGILVEEQSTAALISALRRFEQLRFDSGVLVEHAAGFSTQRFQRELLDFVSRAFAERAMKAGARWS
jgi:glycosyltransferase involved in cell wall biosynthesis